jgi:hypothetical protein
MQDFPRRPARAPMHIYVYGYPGTTGQVNPNFLSFVAEADWLGYKPKFNLKFAPGIEQTYPILKN